MKIILATVGLFLGSMGAAAAADALARTGPSEVTFLVQVLALLLVGRLLGEAMHRLGQPAVMGQLIGGIVLGPSVLGAISPDFQQALFPKSPDQKAMLDAVSQLGILLLLLLTGMETDLALVRKVRRAALSVSVTGIAVPFICGFLLGESLPEEMLPKPELRLITSLFLGTALSISSVKIVAMVVREMNFLRRNVGQIIVASAIIDDTIGWVIIAVTLSLALHGSVDLWSVGQTLLGAAMFLGLSFTVGRRIVFLLIRWANDELQSEAAVLTAILALMSALALATHAIGVHTVLGAFVAGILVGQSPILTRRIDDQLRGLVSALFAPVFFGLAGLSTDLTVLQDPKLLFLTGGLIAIASIGKFVGAFSGGAMGGLRARESLALACGMNARGSTEVIVATIGLSMGALSQNLFTMIVAMAVITTMAMPPTLRWALRRVPLEENERLRLEQEAFEARGFVPNLERLLVAADNSPKGVFASRIAALMAGSRGMLVTVIRLAAKERVAATSAEALGEMVSTTVVSVAPETSDQIPEAVEVKDQTPDASVEETVALEAQKGYGLLLVGINPTVGPEGGLTDAVADAAKGFDGPVLIIAARGAHVTDPQAAPLTILVPVNGTETSRRALEVALTLARSTRSPIAALFVSNAPSLAHRKRLSGLSRNERAIVKDVSSMAENYGVSVKTKVRFNMAPDEAILREARMGQHNLIIMGVARRPGEGLALGNRAEAVLEASDRSVMFLAS